jgi:hypothetical protein
MELTSKNVDALFKKCLYTEGEVVEGHIPVEGVITRVGFHPGRIEENKVEIENLLNQLPDSFSKSMGGGHSFLQACVDNKGRQWGEHRNIDQLLMLGLAIGKAHYCIENRQAWRVMPGGMPYFYIDD